MRVAKLRKLLSRNAVTLAVYWLADETGARCSAIYGEIASQSGVSAETVKAHLREMEEDGTIAVFWIDRHPRCREIVILDHPNAMAHLKTLAVEHNGTPSPYSRPVLPIVDAIWAELGGRDHYLMRRAAERRAAMAKSGE